MPSRHKRYQTEYVKHFQPLGARRPHTVKGEFTRSQSCGDLRSIDSTPRAGLTSANLGNTFEPQLQRRRIVPYRNNHNIFATDTVKELPDRVWLGRDDGSSVASQSSRGYKKSSKTHINGHSKKSHKPRDSPLLIAEKKMLSHSAPKKISSPPYVPDRINRKSTYSRDFVNYKSKESSKTRKKDVSPKKPIGKSSQGGVSPDRLPPAGIRTITSIGDKRLLQTSDDSDYLRFAAHGNSRVFNSEYKSHYKSPTSKKSTKFKYIDGLWIEAPATLDRGTYEEVLERRNEAYNHANRARGTHFSRENLNQQNLEQAMLAADQSPRSVSSASSSKHRHEKTQTKERKFRSEEKPPQRKQAWSNVSDYGGSESVATFGESLSESDEVGFLERGRSPTPELREVGQTRRHHLDVTTNLFDDSQDMKGSPSKPHMKKKSSHYKENGGKDVLYSRDNHHRRKEPAVPSSRASSVSSGHERKNGHARPPSSAGYGSEAGSYRPRQRKEEDVMSEAAMSSRASVASETFDRARKRRDEFWDR